MSAFAQRLTAHLTFYLRLPWVVGREDYQGDNPKHYLCIILFQRPIVVGSAAAAGDPTLEGETGKENLPAPGDKAADLIFRSADAVKQASPLTASGGGPKNLHVS